MTYGELKQCESLWAALTTYAGPQQDLGEVVNELSKPVVWETKDIDWRYYVYEPVKQVWNSMPMLGRLAIYVKAISDCDHDDWDREGE